MTFVPPDANASMLEAPAAALDDASLQTPAGALEVRPGAAALGTLADAGLARPTYVPKQPNDMRRVGLDALEHDA